MSNGDRYSKLPGEATLYGLMPKGYTLLGMIAGGIAVAVMSYVNIEANAGNIGELKAVVERNSQNIQELTTQQKLGLQKLDTYIDNQARQSKARDERDARMLDALEEIANGSRR